jgi:Co/Zn/Cd efflux system component
MAFQRSMKNDASRRAERTLILVSLLTLIFIAAELVGGLLAHSLAIMTDAFHMISDLGSFMISIMAIHLARRNPTARYSFGFQRAEVLGALTRFVKKFVRLFYRVQKAHIFSACSSFSFLPYTSAVIIFLVCADM